MSEGLMEFLKAKKLRDETGMWPPAPPAFSEAEIKAILQKLDALPKRS